MRSGAVCARRVRALERSHEAGGLAGIAYNAVVCPHGSVFEGRGPGVGGHDVEVVVAEDVVAREFEFGAAVPANAAALIAEAAVG